MYQSPTANEIKTTYITHQALKLRIKIRILIKKNKKKRYQFFQLEEKTKKNI